MFKRILILLGSFLGLLLVYVTLRTFTDPRRQLEVKPIQVPEARPDAVARLAKSVTFQTVAGDPQRKIDPQPFYDFQAFLQESFPTVYEQLRVEQVAGLSLLFTWPGSNPDLKPIVLLGHQDVVPIASEERWSYPPWDSTVAEGFIWGRGTLDDKVTVMGLLEAAERLLQEGFVPERTIYLAFGHDEETLGSGAQAMADLLDSRGVQAEFIMDEGSAITRGLVPGIKKEVALVAIAEKGFLTVTLNVKLEDGGHSSLPPQELAIEILSRAIVKIRKKRPRARLSEPMVALFDYLGPEMSFPLNVVAANQDLLAPIIASVVSGQSPSGNASVRTTVAPTIIQSGTRENILPTVAQATVNLRILPGETVTSTVDFLNRVIDDSRVGILIPEPDNIFEPTDPASPESFGYRTIECSIKEVYPEVLVGPSLAVGYTDVRRYSALSQDLYRFLPFRADGEELKRIHGIDERISIEDFSSALKFYEQIIRNGSRASLGEGESE